MIRKLFCTGLLATAFSLSWAADSTDSKKNASPGKIKADTAMADAATGEKSEAWVSAAADLGCPQGMVGIKASTGSVFKAKSGFCIDMYEFPNTAESFPMNQVTWGQAKQFCRERGKRLCEDAEWLAACRGPQKFKYPYGNKYDAAKCVTHKKYFVKVGTHEDCKSAYGVYDMSGNVAEWTAGGGVVSFGGNWDDGKGAKCNSWNARAIDGRYNDVGFRCCMDAPKP